MASAVYVHPDKHQYQFGTKPSYFAYPRVANREGDVTDRREACDKKADLAGKQAYNNNPCLLVFVAVLAILIVGCVVTIGILLNENRTSEDVSPTKEATSGIEVPPDTVPIQGQLRLKEWYYHSDLMDINSSMSKIYAKTICTELTTAITLSDVKPKNCVVVKFLRGSVIASFVLIVTNSDKQTDDEVKQITQSAIDLHFMTNSRIGDVKLTRYEVNYCQDAAMTSCDQLCVNIDSRGQQCGCMAGYKLGTDGETCFDIDECLSNNGYCDQRCVNTVGSYYCSCDPGYILDTDSDTCQDVNECLSDNGGCEHLCVNTPGTYHCDCVPGYTLTSDSRTCDGQSRDPAICPPGYKLKNEEHTERCVEINECESDPCKNNGSCVDQVNSFTCQCVEGYEGQYCERNSIVSDSCASSPCENAGTCRNTKKSYLCSCPPGVTGSNCEFDIDECLSVDAVCAHTCTNTLGSYTCSCKPGYTLLANGQCLDIDECSSSPCVNGGTCVNKDGSYMCLCPQSYGGIMCQHELLSDSGCNTSPCLNGATCYAVELNHTTSYVCKCPEGYRGTICEQEIAVTDMCHMSEGPCQNGALCHRTNNGYVCQCPSGLCGVNCNYDVDECLSADTNKCSQLCINTFGGYTCHCLPGYELEDDGKTCTDIDECVTSGCDYCNNTIGSYRCWCPDGFHSTLDSRMCFKLKTTLYPSSVLELKRNKPLRVLCFANITGISGSILNDNSTYHKENISNDVTRHLSVTWYDISGTAVPKDGSSKLIHQNVMVMDGVMTAVLMGMFVETRIHVYRCEAQYYFTSHQSLLTVNISDPKGKCTNVEYHCLSGECVPDPERSVLCNNIQDCADGSDEWNCHYTTSLPQSNTPPIRTVMPQACREDQFQCHSGQCISYHLTCDGLRHCIDGSDELNCYPLVPTAIPTTTKKPGCMYYEFTCNNSQCISGYKRCDGNYDCDDKSDETNCKINCTEAQFSCDNSTRCVSKTSLCDGITNCVDLSDELNCTCSKDQFRCANGLCVHESQWCDGINDCVDGSDEPKDCRHCVMLCAPNQIDCDGGCLKGRYVCDGIRHCSDGKDERDCHCNEARCDDGMCIAYSQLCDRKVDCADKSDESRCISEHCNEKKHLISCDERCIPESWRCDGKVNCVDTSDELLCNWVTKRDWLSGDVEQFISSPTMAPCRNDVWINTSAWCDGTVHCVDGSDEYPGCEPGCPPNYYHCDNGECIHPDYVCDYWADCSDHSDELHCDKTVTPCPPDFLTNKSLDISKLPEAFRSMTQCRNGMCVPTAYFCDGIAQCLDGSDEMNCSNQTKCKLDEFSCDNGKCISLSWICDGDNDCGDLSDESHDCTCQDNSQRCANGVCLNDYYFCNGKNDCGDWSDEKNCECQSYEGKCANGTCISLSLVCNGHNDCGDWSDEMKCPVCKEDELACSGSNFTMCIPPSRYCDRVVDCPGGEDELDNCHTRCPRGTFSCDGRCFEDYHRCDGIINCVSMEDEQNCQCKYYEFSCGVCLHRQRWCNGIVDCPDGSDELVSCLYRCPEGFGLCYDDNQCYSPIELCLGLKQCHSYELAYNCSDISLPKLVCGQPEIQPLTVMKLIFGGQEAIPHSWPWQVDILYNEDGTFVHQCGGSIIANQWILTASHCFEEDLDIEAYNIVVGSHSTEVVEINEKTFNVSKIIMHEDYNTETVKNDIALVRLSQPMQYSAHVMPVCLDMDDVRTGTNCIITGWGTTLNDAEDETVLHQASVRVLEQRDCKKWYADITVITENMLCAGHRDARAGTCQGDSGGPLVCLKSNSNIYTLAGVTSFARSGCQLADSPGVFTRISHYISWIQDHVGELSNVIQDL